MRIQELIRGILDLLDGEQSATSTVVIAQPEDQPGQESPLTNTGDDINRWRQIVDLADQSDCSNFENEPNEKYADIEAVTTHAGGGVNGPKNPHDIRVKDPSAYPNQQEF